MAQLHEKPSIAEGVKLPAQYVVPWCEEGPPGLWLLNDITKHLLGKAVGNLQECEQVHQYQEEFFDHLNSDHCKCGTTYLPQVKEDLPTRAYYEHFHNRVFACMDGMEKAFGLEH